MRIPLALYRTRFWMTMADLGAGIAAMLAGTAYALNHGGWLAAAFVAGGAVLTIRSVSNWRSRRADSGLLRAVARFRETARTLQGQPVLYIHDDTNTVLIHTVSKVLLLRVDTVSRVAHADVDLVMRALEDNQLAHLVFEEFEINQLSDAVLRTTVGESVKVDGGGEMTLALVGAPVSRWQIARGRLYGLRNGLLQASEAELVELCDQLVAARPVDTSA